jgi:anti-anti-sigma regulatory factor
MEIVNVRVKRCTLVTVLGRVDSATAPQLEKALFDIIRAGEKNIVVNVRGVKPLSSLRPDGPHISSAGMKALLLAQMKVRKAIPPGNVVISELPPGMEDDFLLVGFGRLFTFYDEDVQAIGSF